MSILIDRDTKVICQGFTGKNGTFHSEQAIAYGTRMVGGVAPGKGGSHHLDLPVFDTVAEAREKTGADASVVYVPPAGAADAICEAIDAEIPLIVCITEGIPVLRHGPGQARAVRLAIAPRRPELPRRDDGRRVQDRHHAGQHLPEGQRRHRVALRHADLRGGVPDHPARASARRRRSASAATRSRAPSSSRCSTSSWPTPRPQSIVMIGEIGGSAEEDAAEFLAREAKQGRKKPTVGFIAGRTAPPGRRMGHAGAIISGGKGGAEDKIAAMEAAGIRVSPSPARLGKTLVEVLKG